VEFFLENVEHYYNNERELPKPEIDEAVKLRNSLLQNTTKSPIEDIVLLGEGGILLRRDTY
jgi:hypothetical protein